MGFWFGCCSAGCGGGWFSRYFIKLLNLCVVALPVGDIRRDRVTALWYFASLGMTLRGPSLYSYSAFH